MSADDRQGDEVSEAIQQLRDALIEDEAAGRASFDPANPYRGVQATADLQFHVRQSLEGFAALDAATAERDRLLAENEKLDIALRTARAELMRWGWGDHHYGDQPQEKSVRDVLALCDAALSEPPQ